MLYVVGGNLWLFMFYSSVSQNDKLGNSLVACLDTFYVKYCLIYKKKKKSPSIVFFVDSAMLVLPSCSSS